MQNNTKYEFKIILLGESGVGKTSLVRAYTTGRFNPKHQSTIVVDRTSKEMTLKGKKVKLCIWETSNQKWFKNVAPNYYDGVLLVYDTTDMTTFCALSDWLTQIKEKSDGAVVLVVGNKIDQPECVAVPRDVAMRFTKDKDLELMESSAKNDYNVVNIFEHLTIRILTKGEVADEDVNCASLPSLNAEKELETFKAFKLKSQKHSLLPFTQNSLNVTSQKTNLQTNTLVADEFNRDFSPPLKDQNNTRELGPEKFQEPILEIRKSQLLAQTLEAAACDAPCDKSIEQELLDEKLQDSKPGIQRILKEHNTQNLANKTSHERHKKMLSKQDNAKKEETFL